MRWRSRTSLRRPDRLEREAVVGALHRPVEREVLLDDPAAEHVGGDRHRDPVVVARVADDRVREQLAVGLDHAQVELVPVLGRIAGGALEQPDLRVDLGDAVVARGGRRRSSPPPVERIIGLPISATNSSSGVFVRSPEAILYAGMSRSASNSALAKSKAVAKNVTPSWARVRLQLLVLGAAELERLAVRAVRRPVAVLVLVRPVEELPRVQAAVVALLELDRVRAAVGAASAKSSLHCSSDPWWLWPISAITQQSVSSAIRVPSMTSSRLLIAGS